MSSWAAVSSQTCWKVSPASGPAGSAVSWMTQMARSMSVLGETSS